MCERVRWESVNANLVQQQPSGCTEPQLCLIAKAGTLNRTTLPGKIHNTLHHKRKHTPDARAVKHWRVLRDLV